MLIVLNIADGLLTLWLNSKGLIIELNPIINKLLSNTYNFILIKIFFITFVILFIIYKYDNKYNKTINCLLLVAIYTYSIVVVYELILFIIGVC
jgi:RsiW-degrading membrane proteinase PrsW (M82 family)